MSRALRYLREGGMSSIGYHRDRQDRVAENVALMHRISSDWGGAVLLACYSEETVGVFGTKKVRRQTVE